MIATATFNCDPRSAKQARQFVLDRLGDFDGTVVDNVSLMASELVTNSIQHSTGTLTLTLEVDEQTIRVAVSDVGPGNPVIRSPQPEEPNGRGLQIIAKLADEWGAGPSHDGGNTVWFSLHVDAPSRRQHSDNDADTQAGTSPTSAPQTSHSEALRQATQRRAAPPQPPKSMARRPSPTAKVLTSRCLRRAASSSLSCARPLIGRSWAPSSGAISGGPCTGGIHETRHDRFSRGPQV